MGEDNVKVQMRKGILEYCILSILSRGDSYAPKIISELKEAQMIVVEGTPAGKICLFSVGNRRLSLTSRAYV